MGLEARCEISYFGGVAAGFMPRSSRTHSRPRTNPPACSSADKRGILAIIRVDDSAECKLHPFRSDRSVCIRILAAVVAGDLNH